MCTRDISVRAPNEHSLNFCRFAVQFMHRNLAVPQSRSNYALWQQCNPDASGHTANDRIDRAEFQGLCNEYSSLFQQIVQLFPIGATNPEDDGFQVGD